MQVAVPGSRSRKRDPNACGCTSPLAKRSWRVGAKGVWTLYESAPHHDLLAVRPMISPDEIGARGRGGRTLAGRSSASAPW